MTYNLIFAALVSTRALLSGHQKLRCQLYWPILLLLFVFAAFRWQVGCDWIGYLNQYEIQADRSFIEALHERDPLWWMAIDLMHSLSLPYEWMNIFSSGVFFAGLHALAKKQPDPLSYLVFAFPVLIMNLPLSLMRQGAAIGIMSFAYCAFAEKKPGKFFALVLLASTLHSSALVFIALTPFVKLHFSALNIGLAAVLTLPGLSAIFSSAPAELAFSRYVGTELSSGGGVFRNGLLALTGIFFYLFLSKSWRENFPVDYKLVSLISIMMVLVFGLNVLSTVIADRFSYYLIPIQAAIFSRTPFLRLGPTRHVLNFTPYLLVGMVFFAWTSLSDHFRLCYTPYQSWILGLPQP